MASIRGLLKKIDAIDLPTVCSESVDETKDVFLEDNRKQMFDGKLKTGADLTPSYLDDPYFKSPEAAKRYSEWKDRITPNPNRKSGTPNLFINGAFYDSLSIQVSGPSISIDSSFYASSSIEAKFSKDIYGLGGAYKIDYIGESLVPAFNMKIERLLK